MSEMKMENSRVPAEKIFNPDLKAGRQLKRERR